MNDIEGRLAGCFRTVFPALPEAEVRQASQIGVEAWDSVATITLANVIEDEFGIGVDFDCLPDLNSFERMHEYVCKAIQAS